MGRRRLAALDGDRRQLAPARDLVEDRLAAAADDALVQAADLAQAVDVLGAPLGDLDQRGVLEHRLDRPVLGRGDVLAPLRQRARDGALPGIQRVDPRQAAEDGLDVARVASRPRGRGTPPAPSRGARGASQARP